MPAVNLILTFRQEINLLSFSKAQGEVVGRGNFLGFTKRYPFTAPWTLAAGGTGGTVGGETLLVDGRNPANLLRLVVYPIIYRVLYIPGGAGFLPSTVWR